MAKIQRNTQKIFAGKGTNDPIAVFGSMKTGNPIYTDNIEDLQSTAYENGWADAIVADEAPFLEEMNGVQYGFSKQLAYLFQEGIPEYDAGTTYYKGSIIKALNTDNKAVLYYSLVDDNLNNPLTDNTKWEEITFDTSGGGFQPALFQPFISLTKLTHPSLVDSADYSWLNNGYVSAYNELVERYNAGENKYWYGNINITGSLTDNQGVLSGFSSANYATLPNAFTSAEITEAQIVFTTGSDINTAQGVFLTSISDNSSSLGIYNGGLYLVNKTSGSTPAYVSLGLPLSANTKYYFKFTQSGTAITPYISTDGTNYTEGTSATRAQNFGSWIGYGLSNDIPNPMLGTIDLNSSYININGSRWWTGAESYRYNEQYLMKIITPEQIDAAEAEFEATGQQPYFILDTANTRFKLPRFKTIPQFTNDANNVGAYNEPKLPNAKGNSAQYLMTGGSSSGAMYDANVSGGHPQRQDGTSGYTWAAPAIDLSRASSIYKDGVNTVQPPTTNFLLYFYLGESEIDDTSITGEVLEELNSKLDNDAGNLTDAGKKVFDGQWVSNSITLFQGLSMHSSSNVTYNLGEYLPNDNYTYEIRAVGVMYTGGDVANSATELHIQDSVGEVFFGRAQTRSNNSEGAISTYNLVVDSTRNIVVIRSTNYGSTGKATLYLNGYRRIGTNE